MCVVSAFIFMSLTHPIFMANEQMEWIAEHRFAGEALTATHFKAGFDSLNVRFVGNWPFGLSYAVCVDSTRNLVFVGSGGGIYVLDVSQVSNPVGVSGVGTRGVVLGLHYDNTTQILYLSLIHISEPTRPY